MSSSSSGVGFSSYSIPVAVAQPPLANTEVCSSLHLYALFQPTSQRAARTKESMQCNRIRYLFPVSTHKVIYNEVVLKFWGVAVRTIVKTLVQSPRIDLVTFCLCGRSDSDQLPERQRCCDVYIPCLVIRHLKFYLRHYWVPWWKPLEQDSCNSSSILAVLRPSFPKPDLDGEHEEVF